MEVSLIALIKNDFLQNRKRTTNQSVPTSTPFLLLEPENDKSLVTDNLIVVSLRTLDRVEELQKLIR